MKWAIEVCGRCGKQLGPGLLSPSPTGRCPEHNPHPGGIVVVIEVDDELAERAAYQAKTPYFRPPHHYEGIQDATAHLRLVEATTGRQDG